MNGYERIIALLEGGQPDRLPFMPITMMFAADQLGVPYGKYAGNHEIMVDAQLLTAERFGFDFVSTISDPAREAADLAAKVHFFDDQPPAIDESAALLGDMDKLQSLQHPDPLAPGGRMLDRVDGIRKMVSKVKRKLFIEGWVEGPCAEAADLRGINTLMLDFMDNPDFVRDLFEFNIETALRFAKAQIDAGADILGMGDAAASLVGPRIFKECVYPYEKRLVDGIHSLGGRVRLHICGNISRSLKEIGTLGCDIVDLDWMVPIARAREEMGPKQVLLGNIDPVKVLRNGTPQSITAALRECHRDAGHANYIVSAGCETPRDTPLANMEAMRRFAESGGNLD